MRSPRENKQKKTKDIFWSSNQANIPFYIIIDNYVVKLEYFGWNFGRGQPRIVKRTFRDNAKR